MPISIEASLARLRNEFITLLPARIDMLEQYVEKIGRGERGAGAMLARAAHSLVGAAGVHRLTEVSAAARRLEAVAASLPPDGRPDDPRLFALHKALARLEAAAESPALGYMLPPEARLPVQIAVVSGDPDRSLWLRGTLEEAGYRVVVFSRPAELAAAGWAADRPAALILDLGSFDDDCAAARPVADLRAQHCPDAPLVFLSARADVAARLAACRAGATHYLTTPTRRDALLHCLASLEKLGSTRPYRVLVVDDDPAELAAQSQALRRAGMEVCETENPLEVPDLLCGFAAEVLLIDMDMPQCSGPELAAMLRADGRHDLVPVVYLSAAASPDRFALEHGAEYLLAKPADARRLTAAVSVCAKRYRQTQEQVEALRATLYERERHQHALDAHAIVSITDTAGNILYANDRFCEASGYGRHELLGQNHRIVKSGMHADALYVDLWQTITRGLIWHGELCNRRKDGSHYWVETTIVPFLDDDGHPYQYISIRTDITRVKEAEQRLARSQAYANIGTWDWNIETGDLYWSERIAPLFGHPEGSLATTYENFLAAVHPEDRLRVSGAVSACVELGREYDIEHRVVWPSGEVRWLLERGDVVRDADGNPLHMLGVVQDVTERKRIEIALEESRMRLEEAQSLAKLGHWTADLVTGALQWSDEIYRIFGLDPARFTPSIDAFTRAVHPDDWELIRASERRAAETGVHDVVHRIIRPDGEVRYVHELAQARVGASGELLQLSGTVQDVTELKQAEQGMQQAKEAAEAASRAKSEFLASMSHELRTPLNSILGFAQLFAMDPKLPPQSKDYAQEIERAGQHLLSLVNDLIDLARIEAGKLELLLAPVRVQDVVTDSLAMVAPIARDRGIQLVDAGGDGCGSTVVADSTRLQQVLINLLSNAIKYNRPAGAVRIGCHAERGATRIAIADDGPGIPADKQARMFTAFDRLGAERGQVEGSGIGLVITRRIVEAMGGSIGFESTEGRGSTFWVTLPVTTAAAPAAATAPLADATAGPATRAYVLYIEDNPMNQHLMERIFAARKHLALRMAHTAEIGIQLARAERPALIMMDINLPGMDGYAALEALRAEPTTAGVPVVAVTANAMKGEEKRGLEAGFDAYVTKPIDIPTLFNVIDTLVVDASARP
ncbi:PAS domain-containing protein [Thiobacillus sedimenti]|uniref:histidine kinase n=1 Tax=Thiobacillus sedimenti TaxID=3110231 RepID=A0ABZ1CMF9_9PROT|nr:PAS domain-containing protein [Thiobacillus sp. SCUT-2]WRS40591.1 PAS domain-containing protein [Thiobacillus sp. SCUT-2]